MKYSLLLLLMSFTVFAKPKVIEVHRVTSIDYKKDVASITFSDMERVYKLSVNSRFIPCIENAWKAEQQVVLGLEKNSKVIMDCKLYGGGIPHLVNYQGGPKQQAQEENKPVKETLKKP